LLLEEQLQTSAFIRFTHLRLLEHFKLLLGQEMSNILWSQVVGQEVLIVVHLAMPMVVTVLILFFTLLLLSVEVVVVHGLIAPDTLVVLVAVAVVIQEQVERVQQVKGTMVDQETDQALTT
jgi:ABC-type multidrug transport system fused ATPase/permease subunit